MFGLITSNSDDNWAGIFYDSAPNLVFTVPNSKNNWTHICIQYNGTHRLAYVNGLVNETQNSPANTEILFRFGLGYTEVSGLMEQLMI